jgi:hypothetical protein
MKKLLMNSKTTLFRLGWFAFHFIRKLYKLFLLQGNISTIAARQRILADKANHERQTVKQNAVEV